MPVSSRQACLEAQMEIIAAQFLSAARRQMPYTLLLDFHNVDFVNAAVLGSLVTLHARLQKTGKRLVLINLSAELFEVFRITRLDTVLDVAPEAPPRDMPRQLSA
jgi:anti-anti-sigma factor